MKDASRLSECLSAFSPLSLLTLEFRHVRGLDEDALAALAGILRACRPVDVRLRGLSLHHLRALGRLGVPIAPGRRSRRLAPARAGDPARPCCAGPEHS